MPKRRIEDEIERLGQNPTPAALKKALSDRVGLLVAKAAKLVAEHQLRDLIPDLLAAFERLLENPVERDPQCWGKNAIAKALTSLDYRDSALYLRGSRHVQMEPVWAGQEDTAPALRGICLLGLVTCSDIRREVVLRRLVDAVMDPAQTVRIEAARALGEMAGDESPLLLRLKALAGDREPPVVGQVFDGLLRLEGPGAIQFIAGFFQGQAHAAFYEAQVQMLRGFEGLIETVAQHGQTIHTVNASAHATDLSSTNLFT